MISKVLLLLLVLSVPLRAQIASTAFIKNIKVDKNQMIYGEQLSESSLPKILARAYTEKNLLDPNFSRESCLKAKSIPVVGSFNTVQLFLVTSTCVPGQPSSYIIKEALRGLEEALSLKAVTDFPGMKELLAPKAPPPGLLSVALPLSFLSYSGSYGGKHYVAIMPLAKGKVLCDAVKVYRDNKSLQNAELLKKTYRTLGSQLGHFHKRFMKTEPNVAIGKTIVHGDFHCLNVFFDENANLVTLIDNETMADFLKNPAPPDDDILKLFLGLASQSEPAERKDMISGIDLQTWYDVAFSNFVEGYAEAFPAAQKQQVYKDLKKIFNSPTPRPWLKIKDEDLKELREKYINPILNKLII